MPIITKVSKEVGDTWDKELDWVSELDQIIANDVNIPLHIALKDLIQAITKTHKQILLEEAKILLRPNMKLKGSIYGGCFDELFADNLHQIDSRYTKGSNALTEPDIIGIDWFEVKTTGGGFTTNKSTLEFGGVKDHNPYYLFVEHDLPYIKAIYFGQFNSDDWNIPENKRVQICNLKIEARDRLVIIYRKEHNL